MGWDQGPRRLVAGVIGPRCALLATLSGGEYLERFEIGMWFGLGLRENFPTLGKETGK